MSAQIVPDSPEIPDAPACPQEIDTALQLMDQWENLPAHAREITWEGDEIVVRGLTLQMFKAVAAAERRPVAEVIECWLNDASQHFSQPRVIQSPRLQRSRDTKGPG